MISTRSDIWGNVSGQDDLWEEAKHYLPYLNISFYGDKRLGAVTLDTMATAYVRLQTNATWLYHYMATSPHGYFTT